VKQIPLLKSNGAGRIAVTRWMPALRALAAIV
jgi:hypothetical protein